jgi:hypothetical protein
MGVLPCPLPLGHAVLESSELAMWLAGTSSPAVAIKLKAALAQISGGVLLDKTLHGVVSAGYLPTYLRTCSKLC